MTLKILLLLCLHNGDAPHHVILSRILTLYVSLYSFVQSPVLRSDEEESPVKLAKTQTSYDESSEEESVKPKTSRKRTTYKDDSESSGNESPVKRRKQTIAKKQTKKDETTAASGRPSRRAASKATKYKESDDSHDDESDYEEAVSKQKKPTKKPRKNAPKKKKQKKRHYDSDGTESTAAESQDENIDSPNKSHNFLEATTKSSKIGAFVQEGGDWRTQWAIDY